MDPQDRTFTLTESGGTPAPARPMPASIGPYRVVGLLGEGGMGVVWEAEQQHPRRRVAVKVMREARHFSDLQARMFEREVETLGRLKHPNIAAIYESGQTEGGHGWFAMELVRGETLDRWLAGRPDPFARDEMVFRLRLFQTVCGAVNYAHQRGVIHRDLKPSNIVVTTDAIAGATTSGTAPRVKVLDFSLARFADVEDDSGPLLTRAGVVRGTPQYMSPEQARGETVGLDVRTDVYPLGMILYEMLALQRPYRLTGLTMDEAVRVICETPPRPLREVWRGVRRLDPDLETIVGKALEKEPDRRYPSAAALSEDVERYLNSEPIVARAPSRAYRARKFLERHSLGVAAAAGAVVLLAGFGVSMAVQARRVARERDRANLEAQAFKRVAAFMAGMFRVSDPSEARGNSITAREILDKAAGQIEKDLAEDPELQARLLGQMSEVYRGLGLYAKAEPLVDRAVEINRRVLGPDDPETLRLMHGQVTLMVQTGRYADAEKAGRELLALQTRALGSDDPMLIRSYNNVAIVCWYQGRMPEARALYEQALDLARRTVGTRHPDALGTMNNLALVDLAEDRIEEAERLFRETYEVRRDLSGADHPDTLKTQVNIGRALQRRGRLEEAEAIYREHYEQCRRVFGAEHPDTLMSMMNLAGIHSDLGRFREAEELQRAILEARRRALGEDNPDTLRIMNDLANSRDFQGRHQEAEAMYRDLIARRTRVLGPEAEETLSTRGDLAEALRNQGRYREARTEIEAALVTMRRVYEPGDPGLGVALYGLACVEALDGRRDRAFAVLDEALTSGIQAQIARRLPTEPALQSLRGDPRFVAIAAKAAEMAEGR